ncbi:PAS domain S-box protein [Bradyrhizobium sp. AUGA SZCCT0240]|uniref:PAS domain S-box protein n=1 Tax=unclassified Bradyrhizobium TaxID=2631580 RepID=UPI001BA706E0|nr:MULTISPECIES: PAS domain S-box protein [unclassified Bradyrhizobium]MBR1190844.1 PAS domain S-box protein [Bradyrhizobium sp. AUGA SZCCT0160]MBR1196055.1 PAS domain S-box protein [Bradyrhizobium sp. AUGA SZCCT0158]MBR1240892.1 PAS domain S-box protein [Bradyrhizobium sp. AUGA SZCCT0274]MBR1252085.1 PAS domain S-box protein [Bradyrhizobium sp. AUGA SZCCT0240]
MSVTLSQSSRWFARPLALVVAVLLTVVVATGFLGFRYWQERQAADLLFERGRQVLETLDRLRTVIADVEAQRRGYLLTLDPSYLKAYGVSDESVRRDAQALQALVASDPLQNHRAGHLALTVAAKLREIDDIVNTARTSSGPAALAMIRSLDEIRSQIDQMVDHERFLRVDQERRAEALERRKAWLIATAVVVVAVLAGAALALARFEARRRRKATEENVQLQSDIEARDRKIRRLVDANIIGIIIWEVDGRILEANDEFLRMVGYDREDLTAGRLHRTQLTPPDWRERDARTVAELKRIGTAQPFEKEYLRKDGSRVPVLIGGAMFEEGTNQGVGFVLDLTERKRAEEALRQSEERFRTLVQFSFDVYWETDAQHRFVHQEFAESLADAPAWGAEIGRTRWEVPYLEPDAEAWRKHRETLDAHLPFRDFELARPAPDGSKRYVSVSGLPMFDERGRFVGYRGVGRHITERKRAEEALRSAQAELAHANRVATLGQLTASVAHEVSQPIAATVLNAQAAVRWLGAQPPNLGEVRQILGQITDDGKRAGDVIGWIRALIKKAPPRKESLEINQAILEVIALTRGEAVQNGVWVRTQLAEGLPRIQADRVQLQQVILNLIINAIEAMNGASEGTRELLISTAADASNGVLVSLRDTGPGLDPASLEHLFDAFYTTKSSGLGMGLSICRSIIEAQGGRIWADANKPCGAAFHFTLPLEKEETAAAEHAGPMPAV